MLDMGYKILMDHNGEDFEILRTDGTTSETRGLRHRAHGEKYIGFMPNTDLHVGESVRSKISDEIFKVLRIEKNVAQNTVTHLKAFYENANNRIVSKHPSLNITVGSMHNSSIMQASPSANVTITLSQENKNNAAELLKAMREVVEQLEESSHKEDITIDIETFETQLKKKSPDVSLIRSVLQGIQSGFSHLVSKGAKAATLIATSQIAEQINIFLASLSS